MSDGSTEHLPVCPSCPTRAAVAMEMLFRTVANGALTVLSIQYAYTSYMATKLVGDLHDMGLGHDDRGVLSTLHGIRGGTALYAVVGGVVAALGWLLQYRRFKNVQQLHAGVSQT